MATLSGTVALFLFSTFLKHASLVRAEAPPPPITAQTVPKQRGNVQWLKSYDGKSTFNLTSDARFAPFVQSTFENLKIAFWGDQPASQVIAEFLSVPGPVTTENHRFVTATGNVAHAGFNHGMLWVDTHEDGDGPIVVFVAIENPQGILWLYSNRNFSDDPSSLPHNLLLNINRWVRAPVKPVLRLNKASIMDTSGTSGKEVAPETLLIPRSRWKMAEPQ